VIGSRSFQLASDSSNRDEFDEVFVRRVHALIRLGYGRLVPAKYASAQETEITGDLAYEIESILEGASESWMRFFRIYDDPPVNVPKKRGKSYTIGKGRGRKRVDIKLDSSETSPYTRFQFESKRLGKNNPTGKYLGSNGLGCFLSGDYASAESRAGMLGYVQQHDEDMWASRIREVISGDIAGYRVTSDGGWICKQPSSDYPNTYVTCHTRDKNLLPIRLYHSLLRFC
jgi:hypothetical protein